MKNTKKFIAALASASLAGALFGCAPQEAQEQAPEPESAPIGIKLNVSAEGWDADASTPVIVQLAQVPEHDHEAYMTSDGQEAASAEEAEALVQAASEADPDAVFTYAEEYHDGDHNALVLADATYHEITANDDAVIELEEGAYELVLISPINADGSIYTVPDETEVEAAEITEDAEPISLELIPADQVTPEQMASVITSITLASELAPESVPDATLERAVTNAAACPAMTEDAIAEVEQAATETATAAKSGDAAAQAAVATAKKPATSASSGNAASSGASAPAASAPSNSGASASSGNSGASAPAASAPSTSAPSSSAPAHEHNWVAQTTQKYVVDVPAQARIVCACGSVFASTSEWGAHIQSLGIAGSNGHSYRSESTPEQGHYETITTGYTCSCGATK